MRTVAYHIDTVEVSSSSLLVPTIKIKGLQIFSANPFFIPGLNPQHYIHLTIGEAQTIGIMINPSFLPSFPISKN